MNKQPGRPSSIHKSARLVLLMQLQDEGRLDGLSLQKQADLLGYGNHRATIMRDLRDVILLRAEINKLKKRLANTIH